MTKRKIVMTCFLVIGLIIMAFLFYSAGVDAVKLIMYNLNIYYVVLYFSFSLATFLILALRWQVIVGAYKKVPFLMLLKQTIAGYSINYTTPTARAGGEPLRVYMLKREAGIDLKTGSTTVIIDRFIDLIGSALFGVVGLVLLFYYPTSWISKILLAAGVGGLIYGLYVLYSRTVKGKGTFSKMFVGARLNKIKGFSSFTKTLKDVESKMSWFFKKHNKRFLISCFIFFFYGLSLILEMKFLLLCFGQDIPLGGIILALTVLGLVNFIPVPASLGFLEAGESGLFFLLTGKGDLGLAVTLLLRVNALFYVAIGFALISWFSGKQIREKAKKAGLKSS